MYENQTEQIIKQRMLDSIPSDIDKSEGSFTFDAIAPAALEIAQTYIELDGILKKAFAQTSYGEWLEKRAAEFGIYRKPATKSEGRVTLCGADGTVIPAGTLVQTDGGLQYRVRGETVISGGSAIADVEAVEEGDKYDVPANAISEMPIQLTGITSVVNPGPITGGSAPETDEALLNRLLTKVRYPATSGNAYHYRQWALEVPDVGDARVFPLWNGPGTVKVVIIDSNKLPPENNNLADDVETYINSVRPVCVSVKVENASPVNINITASISLAEGYDRDAASIITQEFRVKLGEYFRDIAFVSDYASYARIGSILLDIPGVRDYRNLLVNSGMSNIPLQQHEAPVLAGVVLTVQE